MGKTAGRIEGRLWGRNGDCICSFLEILEVEKVGDLPKKRINQTYLSMSISSWFSYLHMFVEAKERHRYVLNPLQTPTFLL